jgi:hypothetical protein
VLLSTGVLLALPTSNPPDSDRRLVIWLFYTR